MDELAGNIDPLPARFLCGPLLGRYNCHLSIYLSTYIQSRVVCRFSIFGRYSVGISWYLLNKYRRKTWLVHLGIIILAGTPFSLKGGLRLLFEGLAPILRKKGFPAKP